MQFLGMTYEITYGGMIRVPIRCHQVIHGARLDNSSVKEIIISLAHQKVRTLI